MRDGVFSDSFAGLPQFWRKAESCWRWKVGKPGKNRDSAQRAEAKKYAQARQEAPAGQKTPKWLGMVAHPYNVSVLGNTGSPPRPCGDFKASLGYM